MNLDRNSAAEAMEYVLRIKELNTATRYERRLIDYCEYVWPVVEPAIPFIKGWAIEAAADHLQAVTEGHIKRLLINVPPGFTKSLMTDCFWPSWEWGPRKMPHNRYVCFSYSNYLTERDNMRCRNIVCSDLYQKLWGRTVTVSSEQFTKVKFANQQTGWKFATSVQGIGVGERGDRLIIDDPNNTMDVESDTMRNSTNMWFREVVPSRLNNPRESAIVIIQQRLHENDISGTAIELDQGYVHLCIPMEYDPKLFFIVNGWNEEGKLETYRDGNAATFVMEHPDRIFWTDPRTVEGDLAWPERFPREEVEKLKKAYTDVGYAQQYQQYPTPRSGAIIKEDYWQPWHEKNYPAMEYILASLDTAFTENESNDYSAMTIWGVFRGDEESIVDRYGNIYTRPGNPKILLMYAWRGRLQFHDLVNKVMQLCMQPISGEKREAFPGEPLPTPGFNIDRLLIEARGNGISVAQELNRLVGFTGKFGIELVNTKAGVDKTARLHSVEQMFASGMVYAPDRDFAYMVIKEAKTFPNASHDDLTDTLSMALRYLRDMNFALTPQEHGENTVSQMSFRPKLKAIYPV